MLSERRGAPSGLPATTPPAPMSSASVKPAAARATSKEQRASLAHDVAELPLPSPRRGPLPAAEGERGDSGGACCAGAVE